MKAKKIVTFALPIIFLAGCTATAYGLTQLEFQKVDKEY
ncbi:putative lipoprotein YajG [Priestia taiwanensis]|nr:putative lipoprotein YajG [Priestia taiwanensis]